MTPTRIIQVCVYAVAAAVLLGIGGSCEAKRSVALHDSLVVAVQQVKDADARGAIWQARYAEAALQSRRVDTVVRRSLARVDTFVLEHPVDSSGWDSATVSEYQTQVSHAMRSCRLLMGAAVALQTACDSALVAKDSQIATRNVEIDILRKSQPSFWQRHWKAAAALGFAGGVWVHARVSRP